MCPSAPPARPDPSAHAAATAAPALHASDLARATLLQGASDLSVALRRVAKGKSEGAIHGARVLTRRFEVALGAMGGGLQSDSIAELVRAVDKARRVLGPARDAQVHAALIELRRRDVPAGARVAAADAAARLARAARESQRDARSPARRWADRLDAKALRRAVRRASWHGPTETDALAREALAQLLGAVRDASANLRSIERIHALRIALKALRYGLELFATSLDEPRVQRAAGSLRRLQRTLGGVNDNHGLLERLRALAVKAAGRGPPGLARSYAALVKAQRARLDESIAEFRAVWKRSREGGLLDKIESLWLAPPERSGQDHAPIRPPRRPTPPKAPAIAAAPPAGPVRLAAIDIGTNSTRLIIAEADPDGTYRILDDEKELTRLGAGLEATGRIDERALEQTAYTVAKMKQIAQGFGAAHIRGVATCAVREAENGKRLVDLIRRWAGLEIEIISGDEEAWLAFRSVAHAFDLSMFSSAVVDVGGGSTEVVLSSSGAVEQIVSLPVGAVRLTERFGGADAASGSRFKAMRKHLRDLLAQRLGPEPFQPQLVIGTGGTCTALAAIAMNRERRRLPHAPPPSAVQGFEIKRSVVEQVLDELRSMSLEARARVPGLSADRADIIVAGVAIVHEIMAHLGATRLRAHDGGIRDGLLLTMVQEVFPGEKPAARANDPVSAAHRFAAACRTDEKHGEQVARLALRLFDQLAQAEQDRGSGAAWARPQQRTILHCACLLLDVGYVINYTKHHVHSYNLIRHSELSGISHQQVEMVALIARYHRAAEPRDSHEHFAALDAADQEVVRRLAAIVRLAVGLDRTHTQTVRDVRVHVRARAARFTIEAEENPSVDIWGAERKAGLFKEVFGLEPQFAWAAPASQGRSERSTGEPAARPAPMGAASPEPSLNGHARRHAQRR